MSVISDDANHSPILYLDIDVPEGFDRGFKPAKQVSEDEHLCWDGEFLRVGEYDDVTKNLFLGSVPIAADRSKVWRAKLSSSFR